MAVRPDILLITEKHIEKFDMDTSPEAMFIEFENMVRIHDDFNQHCNDTGLTKKMNAMKRSERLKEKRKLFTLWYFQKNQNTKFYKEMIMDLSEMVFATTRTVQNDLFDETTA